MNNTTDVETINAMLRRLSIEPLNPGASDGINWYQTTGEVIESYSPADGKLIARVKQATPAEYDIVVAQAQRAFLSWRLIPAPQRGEIVRQMALAFREYKEDLGMLVSYEMGKVYREGLGEVQEMIDIADFAVGLSRQLYGLSMHSERPMHRMYEQYHPLGITGIVSAFNFPVAVWAWNAMIALVCGDVVVWKPSSKTMLCAIAVQKITEDVLRKNGLPAGIVNLIAGGSSSVGDAMLSDKRLPLISVTGSTRVGRHVNKIVGERFGRTILELGGNNAIIISQYANLNMALPASLFGAIATAGQRCTTTRRLIIHDCIFDRFRDKLIKAYKQLRIGNPLNDESTVGPLVDKKAVNDFLMAQKQLTEQGGTIVYGGQVLTGEGYESGCYVIPCIAEAENHYPVVQQETFAPILYLIKYKTLEEAITYQNSVPQGLSSAIFSKNMLETEYFLSLQGSDCGIANVNIATNGAEIGGAFGGEKETGGGRESGSDAWKAYMRRQTNTINYGSELPLAQGIKFDFFDES
jgi:aldehyde dehydrogenase (NAD+)